MLTPVRSTRDVLATVCWLFALLLGLASLAGAAPLRVACVGDSITAGSGTRLPLLESYPAQLARMLPPDQWLIGNFGVSGATLMNSGDKPYQQQPAFKNALDFRPDIVVIMLGTNDSKPQNWVHQEDFSADYRDLIRKFTALPRVPRIYLCRPPFVAGENKFKIDAGAVSAELPLIDALAQEEGVPVIDLHGPLTDHADLLPDAVHPTPAGAHLLARAVYRALTGGDFTGEMAAAVTSEWFGFKRLDFELAGRSALLVLPAQAAPGRPWIWRPEFFGTEPQTDRALLEKGFHVAYVDLRDLYGAPVALDAMDAFYDHLTAAPWRLSARPTLEGFSRGGLFAFAWAARHPERVSSLYLDAPVCDFKSWPAGKGQGTGSPADWERLKQVYGFTEEQALASMLNPVDQLAPLAKAKIPLLSVCGDADKTVPYVENTAVVESRYRALGGEITVILKPGVDHHPHSLADPAPIVDFVLAHTR